MSKPKKLLHEVRQFFFGTDILYCIKKLIMI